jgi:hypothetical protein
MVWVSVLSSLGRVDGESDGDKEERLGLGEVDGEEEFMFSM